MKPLVAFEPAPAVAHASSVNDGACAPRRELHRAPFSCRGSWLGFFRRNAPGLGGGLSTAPLSLRMLAGGIDEPKEVFHVELERAGEPVLWGETIAPGALTLAAAGPGGSRVRVAYQDPDTVRMRAEGFVLRLDLCRGEPVRAGRGVWRVKASSLGWLLLTPLAGRLTLDRHAQRPVFRLHGEGDAAELLVHRTTSSCRPPPARGTIEDCVARQRAALAAWRGTPTDETALAGRFSALRERELDGLWNLTVRPLGAVCREVTLVSKGTLIGLWSWDHCWHALGVASVDPELAWNNFMALFDHQDPGGALPDLICANEVYWGNAKPPVHGWLLGLLEERHAWFGERHRREIYAPLARLTEFWLRERDDDGDGVPNYLHGNDSGWDNATVFDQGVPLETPDLAAWLVLQQEWLARTARRLGDEEAARRWEKGAAELLARLLGHFWTGERFVARLSGTHEAVQTDSLLLRVPLILGERLPAAARAWCREGLADAARFRGAAGLRSEARDSAAFNPDGYWRGAVWPVTVFIFAEALRASDAPGEAEELEADFLRHVAAAGNFENYRGDDGRGVRDACIAWTSSCVLWFLDRRARPLSRERGSGRERSHAADTAPPG